MRNRSRYQKPRRRSFIREAPGVVLGFIAIVVTGWYSGGDLFASLTATARGCDIKGNISINSGEKIFHVPGQEDYAGTRISPQYGERWFCTEAEARAAGWRKATR